MGGIAAKMLVGKEQDLDPGLRVPVGLGLSTAGKRPFKNIPAVRARAHRAAVLADEGLDRGRAVHVGDGDDCLVRADLLELLPAFDCLVDVCHVRHRAAGAQVGQDDLDCFIREDVSAFGHEVDAAEDHELGILLPGGDARKLETIAGGNPRSR